MTEFSSETREPSSLYLDYLPAIYTDDPAPNDPEFFSRFLLSFQQVITGTGNAELPGIEEILDGIPEQMAGIERYFTPGPDDRASFCAPPEFLEWLSGWVAMELRADTTETQQRAFIANAVSLYRLRGTRAGLRWYLQLFAGEQAVIEIDEGGATTDCDEPEVRVSNDGEADDADANRQRPFHFSVSIYLNMEDPPGEGSAEEMRLYSVYSQIIDQQKPAHTYYSLTIEFSAPSVIADVPCGQELGEMFGDQALGADAPRIWNVPESDMPGS